MSDSFDVPTMRVKSGDSYAVINLSDYDADKHEAIDVPPAPPAPPVPAVPLAPGAPDPLVGFGDDWEKKDAESLKQAALALTGRAVENKRQAIEVIAAEIKRRAEAASQPPVT